MTSFLNVRCPCTCSTNMVDVHCRTHLLDMTYIRKLHSNPPCFYFALRIYMTRPQIVGSCLPLSDYEHTVSTIEPEGAVLNYQTVKLSTRGGLRQNKFQALKPMLLSSIINFFYVHMFGCSCRWRYVTLTSIPDSVWRQLRSILCYSFFGLHMSI